MECIYFRFYSDGTQRRSGHGNGANGADISTSDCRRRVSRFFFTRCCVGCCMAGAQSTVPPFQSDAPWEERFEKVEYARERNGRRQARFKDVAPLFATDEATAAAKAEPCRKALPGNSNALFDTFSEAKFIERTALLFQKLDVNTDVDAASVAKTIWHFVFALVDGAVVDDRCYMLARENVKLIVFDTNVLLNDCDSLIFAIVRAVVVVVVTVVAVALWCRRCRWRVCVCVCVCVRACSLARAAPEGEKAREQSAADHSCADEATARQGGDGCSSSAVALRGAPTAEAGERRERQASGGGGR